jgi:hypothetical protein
MKLKIEGTKFSRDLHSMAVLCNDRSVIEEYKREMTKFAENRRRDQEINKLKQDISDIKSMLETLINRGSNG